MNTNIARVFFQAYAQKLFAFDLNVTKILTPVAIFLFNPSGHILRAAQALMAQHGTSEILKTMVSQIIA